MAAMLLVWMGLLLGSPTLEAGSSAVERAPAEVRLGSGDRLGERMFGRALHRRRILLAEQRKRLVGVRREDLLGGDGGRALPRARPGQPGA